MHEGLVVRAQDGDQQAFADLIIASHPRLFRLANGILGNKYLAEDATQQAYLDIWRNLRRLRDPARFEAWSYRIVVRSCYREAKHTPRWLPHDSLPVDREPKDRDRLEVVLDRDLLERSFGSLSVDQRAVVVLHHLMDMTLEQVAATLDVPPGTVNSRLSRALAAMRAALEADARFAESVPATQEATR